MSHTIPPPPPPPMCQNIPPPPPMFGGPGSPPPPPPLRARMAAKPSSKIPMPHSPMRLLNWTKLSAYNTKDTIFKQLDENRVADSLNFSEMESLFRKKEKSAETGSRIGTPKRESSNKMLNKIASLVDPRRAQNIGIFLTSTKKTPAEIATAIKEMDMSFLSPEILEQLLNVCPTSEEVQTIKEYMQSNDPEKLPLGPAEAYFYEVSSVLHLESRLKACLYKYQLPEKRDSILEALAMFQAACKEIDNSKKFQQILEIILAIGNFLNFGSNRGSAEGYRIDILVKMRDTKTVDNRSNLMQYFASIVEEKFPDLLDFAAQDLPSLITSSSKVTMTMAQTQTTLSEITKMTKETDKAVQDAVKLDTSGDDDFVKSMSEMMEESKKEILQMTTMMDDTLKMANNLITKFGEDSANFSLDNLVGLICQFWESFKDARKELEVHRIKIAREKKRELERQSSERKKKMERRESMSAWRGSIGVKLSTGNGLLDCALSDMRDGSFIRETIKTRKGRPTISRPNISEIFGRKDSRVQL
eukprot:TRINITY_DN4323_c0_g1_i1.p1 TRINITY_DN4323_c0_g1~~TRINITY_DN4323_c0_g1_i1.p1  ORF type:complete len:530 (+),score=160.71 TRINITY_DN4323_c0_g1_i1:1984-3573(+)